MEYEDTVLIECNRKRANTKSSETNASWTNNLADTVKLDPGDKVSVYSSFISERGSGQQYAVEFSGDDYHPTRFEQPKKIKYTPINTKTITWQFNDQDYPYTQTTDIVEEEIVQTDNEANIILQYYKTTDLNSTIQLPRRFIPRLSGQGQWTAPDSKATGRVNREVAELTPISIFRNGSGIVFNDYRAIPVNDAQPPGQNLPIRISRWIIKNDNTRMTIMVRKKTFLYNYEVSFNDRTNRWKVPDEFRKPYWARDPESDDYVIYREKKTLKVKKGFSSPEFVATEITRQLKANSLNDTQLVYMDSNGPNVGDPNPQLPLYTKRTLGAETYKPFKATNDVLTASNFYNAAINNLGTLAPNPTPGAPPAGSGLTELDLTTTPYSVLNQTDGDAAAWYLGYQYIGIKRPEIYEAGSELNSIFGISLDDENIGSGANFALTPADTRNKGIVLDLLYNFENCMKVKKLLDAQALYPELWDNQNIRNLQRAGETNPYSFIKDDPDDPTGDIAIYNQLINENNSRFLHINPQPYDRYYDKLYSDPSYKIPAQIELDRGAIQLGCSYYDFRGTKSQGGAVIYNRGTADDPGAENVASRPFFFRYNPDDTNIFYDSLVGNKTVDGIVFSDERASPYLQTINDEKIRLTFGCMGNSAVNPNSISGRIIIYPNLLQPNRSIVTDLSEGIGLPDYLFPGGLIETQNRSTKVGFDRHWNAWSTSAIGLTSGIPSNSYYQDEELRGVSGSGIADNTANSAPLYPNPTQQININAFNNEIYLGADNPTLGYDGGHFFFESLHTSLNKGDFDNNEVGKKTGDGGNIVYKINPLQNYHNFSPAQMPYNQGVAFKYKNDTSLNDDRVFLRLNENIEPFNVFDTTTGVFIEDLGYSETGWEMSLWNKLGWTYEQLQSSSTKSDRNTRIESSIQNLNIITTNSKIDGLDTKSWNQNQFFSPFYDGSILHAKNIILQDAPTAGTTMECRFLPQIVQLTKSMSLRANEYPKSMMSGYYAIRSDIVPTRNFIGGNSGNTALPILGIIDKQSPQGDYYFGTEQDISFTIDKPTIIASVNVEITDPDGTYASVSDSSSIIFKIRKIRQLDVNIAREVFEEAEKLRKKSK